MPHVRCMHNAACLLRDMFAALAYVSIDIDIEMVVDVDVDVDVVVVVSSQLLVISS